MNDEKALYFFYERQSVTSVQTNSFLGYFQKNKHNAYSMNNISGTPNKDGSFTIHFGGDPESVNYLHIREGWNYSVRLYQPRKEILDGTWIFPTVQTVK